MRKKKLAWVLSPGFLRGWLQFGIMDRLNKMGLEPDIVVGSSIGAYVGIAPATKTPIDLIEVYEREWSTKTCRGKNLSLNYGHFSCDLAIALLRKYFPNYQTFEDLPLTFITVATDFETGKQKLFFKGPLYPAIQASIGHPIFPPVAIDGRYYYDGAFSNPAPIDVARAHGADYVIFIDSLTEIPSVFKPDVRELSKTKKLLLSMLPNNNLPFIGKLYIIFSAIVRRHEIEGIVERAAQAFCNNLILKNLSLYPPDVYINLSSALDGDIIIPLSPDSFKHGSQLIDRGRQVVDQYTDQLGVLKQRLLT